MRAGGDSAEEQEAAEQAGVDRLASSRSIEDSGDFAIEPDRHVRTVCDAESLEISNRPTVKPGRRQRIATKTRFVRCCQMVPTSANPATSRAERWNS